ncbi:MAG TPA: hypothetical protein VFZ61_29050 [Polyangiales bacterium]
MAYAKRGAWVAAAISFLAACADEEKPETSDAGACAAPGQCIADASPIVPVPEAGLDTGAAPAPVDATTPAPTPDTGVGTPPPSDAGTSTPPADAGDAGPTPPVDPGKTGCLKGTSQDYRANGPYQVKSKDVMLPTLGPYTIFYPTELSSDCPHPIVGWGNGTGVTGSGTYAHFFRHAASWGIVTIVAHNSNAGSMPFIAGGIDYLLKENMTSGSEFFGKLSTRAGSAGHSQGGFAALTASSHPNIKAIVNVQGGGRAPASAAMICLTGVMDFVRPQCTSSYTGARGPAFLADHNMADHTGTPTPLGSRTPAGQEYIRMYSSWFRCFLGDDQAACGLYRGAMPPVCTGGDWAMCSGKMIP